MGCKGAWRKKTEQCIQGGLASSERAGELYIPETRSLVRSCRLRCDAGRLCEPQWGMFARVSFWAGLNASSRSMHILRSLQRKHPHWVFCGPSAALAYGLPVSASRLGETHVTLPSGERISSHKRVRVHVAKLDKVMRALGLRVTSLQQTVMDCAREFDFCEALAVADAGLRHYAISRAELLSFAEREGKGLWRIAQARRVLAYADGLSESWGESVARGLMIQLGFMVPELRVVIDLPAELGGPRRVDFLWRLSDGTIIIGEFDGKVKYRDQKMLRGRDTVDVLVDERQRESRLTATGAAIVRFTYDDLRNPMQFAGLLDAYGVPRQRACLAA